jgi:preprotein translocase subunit SecE
MGRIQKKKDPDKKKAQQLKKAQGAVATNQGHQNGAAVKPAPLIKKHTTPDKAKSIAAEPNIMQKSVQFLREVKIELKKVTWPTRKQTMGSTVVVIILVMIISLFLGLVDVSLSKLMQAILQ